jgi:lysophospholipase L1-like esterase
MFAALTAFALAFLAGIAMPVRALADTSTVKPVLLDDWGAIHAEMVADATARADKIKIAFAGDSITARWTRSPGQAMYDQYYAPVGAINLGISADGTQHLLWRLQHGVLKPLHPKMVILLIGTNNLASEPDAVAYGVWSIVSYIRTVLPNTRVLVQGIFPRSDNADYNRKLQVVNGFLAKMDDGKMVKYLYFGDKYLNADGTVNADLITDKVHPNTPDGFKIWNAAIQPTVQEWLAAEPIANVPPPPSPVPTPANLGPATPQVRNDFLWRHNRVLATSPVAKAACELVFMGGETMSCWDRNQDLFKKEFGQYHALNFALWGSRPENMLWQVDNGELDGIKPKVVVLNSQEGLQGAHPQIDTLAAGIAATAKLIQTKSSTTKVLIVGACPLGAKPTDSQRHLSDSYNALLAKLDDGKSVFFVDPAKAFLNADGTVIASGIPSQQNTTAATFDLWASSFRDSIAKLMQPIQ